MNNKKSLLYILVGLGLFGLTACSDLSPESEVADAPRISNGDHYERGKYYLQQGYNGLALNQFKLALQYSPEDIASLNAVAITYQRLNRSDMADKFFHRAILLDINSAQTLNNMGYFHLTQGRLSQALGYFEAARNDHNYVNIAEANIELVAAKIEYQAKVMKASLVATKEIPEPLRPVNNASLERMSNSVYMLNTKENRIYEKAIIHLKMDPRLVIRSTSVE